MSRSFRKVVAAGVTAAFLAITAAPLQAAPLGIAGAQVSKAAPSAATEVRRGRNAAIIAGAVALGVIGAAAAANAHGYHHHHYYSPNYDPYAPAYDAPYGYAPAYAAPRKCWQEGFQGISDGQWVPC
jgi:hypothetical protein